MNTTLQQIVFRCQEELSLTGPGAMLDEAQRRLRPCRARLNRLCRHAVPLTNAYLCRVCAYQNFSVCLSLSFSVLTASGNQPAGDNSCPSVSMGYLFQEPLGYPHAWMLNLLCKMVENKKYSWPSADSQPLNGKHWDVLFVCLFMVTLVNAIQ